MALQVQTAYNKFQRYKQDISDVSTELFLDWCNTLNWSLYRKLVETTPDKFFNTYVIPYSEGTNIYSLPSDFEEIKGWKSGVFPTNADGKAQERVVPYTSYGASQYGYYLDGNNIVFTPSTGKIFSYSPILRYTKKNITLESFDDYFTVDATANGEEIISNSFVDFAIKAIDVLYSQWDEDSGMESLADFRFIRVLDEILKSTRKTPNVYGLDDLSINY